MSAFSSSAGQHVWVFCGSFNCVIDWLDHWQTLIAGAGAVVAAVVSIMYLRKQIAGEANRERARRRRRLAAARARLQLALSDTTHYANDAMKLLKQCLDAPQSVATATLRPPTLPETAVLAFEAVIEATDDEEFAAYLAELISNTQVLSSRLSSVCQEAAALGPMNMYAYLMNAAKVYGYAAGCFGYARRETSEPPHALNWGHAIGGLDLNGLHDVTYPDLHAFMQRAADRAGSLGEA